MLLIGASLASACGGSEARGSIPGPSVSVQITHASLLDDIDTGFPIEIGRVSVVDGGAGRSRLALSGRDADLFTLEGPSLQLRAGAFLDADARPHLELLVEVDDPGTAASPDGSEHIAIAVRPGSFSTRLLAFDFVNFAGRAGHEGLVPISTEPVVGKHLVEATVLGMVDSMRFLLTRMDGSTIDEFEPTTGLNELLGLRTDVAPEIQPSRRRPTHLFGRLTVPGEPFLVAVEATTSDGGYTRILHPHVYRPRSIEVLFEPFATVARPGERLEISVNVANAGSSDRFEVRVTDSGEIVEAFSPATLVLGPGQRGEIVISGSVPGDAAELDTSEIRCRVVGVEKGAEGSATHELLVVGA